MGKSSYVGSLFHCDVRWEYGLGVQSRNGAQANRREIQPAFLSLLLAFLAATPVLTATLILFGAPITTHHAHTLLCAAHLSLLATLPLVYAHGVDGETWRDIVALLLPVDEVYGGMIGTFLGAWLGAVPIPLDW